jgi:hypothetical protein
MNWQKLGRVRVLVANALLLVTATGCPFIIPPVPESVLQGTWELTGDLVSPDVTDFLITFDRDGEITEISYVLNGITTVTIDSDSLVRSSSEVNGSDVSISASWGAGSTLFFEGTLNSGQTQIVGSTGYRIVITGSITIDIPTGPATLTRQ